MKQRENNLTQFFTEYLSHRSDKIGLNAPDITMACFGALNEMETNSNMAEVLFDMRNDFEYILKVLDNLAKVFTKEMSYDAKKQRESEEGIDYLTIPEVSSIYSISQQAIRKACYENRLPFKEGKGKNKYLIRKADIELYMRSAKGKGN